MISHPSVIISPKVESMNAWKVGGELHCPKNITKGSYRPKGVVNAAFHLSPSLIWMLLYPHQMSILEKYLAPFSLSMRVAMRGRG